MRRLLEHPYMVERAVTVEDVYAIVEGAGGNNKSRFQIGTLYDGETEAVRAAQGHSIGVGVDPDVLPYANDVCYAAHGTSLVSAKNISCTGLSRGDRVHIHFAACDRNGNLTGSGQIRFGPQALVIVAVNAARDAGIRFYRASNGVILSGGIDGVIPPRFIRAIKLIPTNDVLWPNEDRTWKMTAPVVNGNPFDLSDTERDTNAVTAAVCTGDDQDEHSLGDGWLSQAENSYDSGSEDPFDDEFLHKV